MYWKWLAVQVQSSQAQSRCKTLVENWDGYKVYTVSIHGVEYVDFYHYSKPSKGASAIFRLKPERLAATINFPLSSHRDVQGGIDSELVGLRV